MPFAAENVIILISSWWDMIVSSITGLPAFICYGFTRTLVLSFLAWIVHVESYIMLWLVLPVVAPPVVLSSEKGQNYEGNILVPNC